MKRKEYLEMQKSHRKELEEFPIAYAFNGKQLEEALKQLGATKEECVSVFGHGDIVKKENVKPFLAMLERHNEEVQRKLKTDPEFAEAAFLYEMDNHEYAINWSGDKDILACFNIDWEFIQENGLQLVYETARNKHMRNAEGWGMI